MYWLLYVMESVALVQLVAYLDVGSNVLLTSGLTLNSLFLWLLFFIHLAKQKLALVEYFSSKFIFFLSLFLPLSLGMRWGL